MVLPHAEDVEADGIGQHDLLHEVAGAARGHGGVVRGARVRLTKAVDTEFHGEVSPHALSA